MKKTVTTRYDVAEHLRTPVEMAAYLEACLEEAGGDAGFIAKALGARTIALAVALFLLNTITSFLLPPKLASTKH